MAPVFHANPKSERVFERRLSQQFKRTLRLNRYKSRMLGVMKPKNRHHRKNEEYNLIVEDLVIFDLPADDIVNIPTPSKKRKLSGDDWNWAPYPRRLKSQRNDESFYDYLSDEHDDSQTVPNWDEIERESCCLSSCGGDLNDSLSSKISDIHIVTIDEVIEYDSMKSPSEHHIVDSPICFDIGKLCEIAESGECYDENLANDQQTNRETNALDTLLTFANNRANNSRFAIYEDHEKEWKDVQPTEAYSPLFECKDSCEVEDIQDQWLNDCQIEKFNFARCFKCRRKVS